MYVSITPPEWYRNVIFGGPGPWTIRLTYKMGWAAKAKLRPKNFHDAQNSPVTSSKRIRGVQNRPVLRSLSLMNCVKERMTCRHIAHIPE